MKIANLALTAALAALTITGCKNKSDDGTAEIVEAVETISAETPSNESATAEASTITLASILADQPEAVKARYTYRNPKLTLGYFGIEPGMTVAEALPGGGWYTKIIMPYLGKDGHLIGIDYDIDMWAKFGGFADEKFLVDRKNWSDAFVVDAKGWSGDNGPNVSGIAFSRVSKDMKDSVDAVVLIRAMHHLNRFDQAHLAGALADIKSILKPGGIVGIVQHRAAEDQDDAWANGDNGYLKQSHVIKIMEDAGFELAADPSEINANPRDKASSSAGDKVWRLPPTLGTSGDDPELKAKMETIGESDRMTLKFRQK